MLYAKLSTAKTFLVGPILDSAGAAKTDEVVASIKVTKNGTVGAVDAQDTLTHDHTGHYKFVSDGGDFDTLGEVTFSLNSGTNAMAPVTFQVLPATTYDAIVTNAAGGANGMLLSGASNKALVSTCDTLTTYTGNTPQTADSNTILSMLKPLSTTVASAISTTSFTLTDGSAVASAYNGMLVKVTDAHAATLPEVRRIVSYAVTTKTVVVDRAFSFTPTAADAVVIGGYADVNVQAISDDSTAADNLELAYDGTGYAGGTTLPKVDLTQILAHTLTNTGTQIADAFQTMFDVAMPVLTCASVNQGADSNTILASATYGLSALKTLLDTTGIKILSIANDAITAASINTGAFTADAFAADALIAATFATGAFTADAFAADALIAATFATGAFTADAFAANALVAGTFATAALNGKGDWSTVTPDAAGTLAGLIGAKSGLPKLDAANGTKIIGFGGADVTVPTVTMLTNLPAAATNWLDAAAVKSDAVAKIQVGLPTWTQVSDAILPLATSDAIVPLPTWTQVSDAILPLATSDAIVPLSTWTQVSDAILPLARSDAVASLPTWVQISDAIVVIPSDTLLSVPTSDAVAKAVLSISASDVENTAAPHSMTTLILGATESSVSGLTWTIRKTGGTTFTTKTVTSDSDAVPITGVT